MLPKTIFKQFSEKLTKIIGWHPYGLRLVAPSLRLGNPGSTTVKLVQCHQQYACTSQQFLRWGQVVFLVTKWLFLNTKLCGICQKQCHIWCYEVIRENCCYWLLLILQSQSQSVYLGQPIITFVTPWFPQFCTPPLVLHLFNTYVLYLQVYQNTRHCRALSRQ